MCQVIASAKMAKQRLDIVTTLGQMRGMRKRQPYSWQSGVCALACLSWRAGSADAVALSQLCTDLGTECECNALHAMANVARRAYTRGVSRAHTST